ncbi:tryptophan synthase subunit alpha [Nitrosomonas communis]|uniref:Tryptophan synthase alpha chain n=1 Tax=Nitrosomonas communis TaxID=44574 RepID=A0A1I4N597_9PROT|nr:tryptophan synthase subunit alpha [Nitrosomonas communis]SFM10658.1 tryptophan synthase, alpha chain [Nitrosomonas communis]
MNRITSTFSNLKAQNKKALIPFITAGDPEPKMTVMLMHALVQAGADIIELGIPFSDPMADGPTIQRSSERALHYHVGLTDVLTMVTEFRKTNSVTPVILMGYANPIEAMGHGNFAMAAKKAGVDGVLIVDYPPEECEEWVQQLQDQKIDPIFLLSPTTPKRRVEKVAKLAKGYVYYVSLKGVTGASHLNLVDVSNKLAEVRSLISIPIGVGFGIRDSVAARAVAELADAVVVGSRIIEEIENSTRSALLDNVNNLVKSLRTALDEVNSTNSSQILHASRL